MDLVFMYPFSMLLFTQSLFCTIAMQFSQSFNQEDLEKMEMLTSHTYALPYVGKASQQ
jgi:hypothetical protein